jgi:hypothetical protein
MLSVKHQCELLDLLSSTAYYQCETPTKPDQDEIDIKNAIDHIHYDDGSKTNYGSLVSRPLESKPHVDICGK